ncbi:hypothetical protein D3C80_1308740 [compost metagenome]
MNEEDRRKLGAFSRLDQDAVQLVAAHIDPHGNILLLFGRHGIRSGNRKKCPEQEGKGKRKEPVRHSLIYHVLHACLTVSAAFKRAYSRSVKNSNVRKPQTDQKFHRPPTAASKLMRHRYRHCTMGGSRLSSPIR